MRSWELGLLWALFGCAQVSTTYTPRRAAYADGVRPTVKVATLAYEEDVAALMQAGGEVMGRIEGSAGASVNQDELRERIRTDAAQRGATHVVLEASYAEGAQPPPPPMAQGGGAGPVRRAHARYVLIKVPLARLNQLPESLRADLIGEPPRPQQAANGASVPSASVATPASFASSDSDKSALAQSLQRARLRKQRAIEQARRHCYERVRVQFGSRLSAEDEAELDAAATSEIDANAIRQLGSSGVGQTEDGVKPEAVQLQPAVAEEPAHPGVIEWFDVCVREEASALEER